MEHNFYRLSPLTILYRVLAQIPGLIIPFYFIYFRNDKSELPFLLIGGFLGLIGFSYYIVDYFYFRYQINDREVIIKRGMIAKKERIIPIGKIQNISIEQKFLQRILGISKLVIETAGDKETEGSLEYVSNKNASLLSEKLNILRTNYSQEHQTQGESKELNIEKNNSNVLYSIGGKELFLFGLINFRLLAVPIIFWFLGIFNFYLDSIFDMYRDNIKDAIDSLGSSANILWSIGVVMIGVISFALVSVAADLIFTFNSYYNFTLTKEGNKLNTSRGFLSKIKGAIPLKKLQMLVLTTNIIKEKFDYWGLKIETAGGSQMRVPEVAVPFAKLDKLLPIVEELFQIGLPNSFKMVSKKSLQRNILRTVMIVGILTGVTAYWLKLQALWLLLLIPVISFYIYKRWVNRAYTIENNKIYVKEGWIYKKIKIIPIDKLQTLKIKETIFQRFWDLATLEIDTAATLSIVDAGIIDIEKHEAETIFSEISETFDKFNTVQTPN